MLDKIARIVFPCLYDDDDDNKFNVNPRYRYRGHRPRNWKQKRIVSLDKFNRVYANNLDSAGVATIYRNHTFTCSLQAVQSGEFIYARFPCKNIAGNMIESYCVRYNLNDPVDYISFRNYPKHVIPEVDF